MDDSVYVSMVGMQVIASRTETEMGNLLAETIHNEVAPALSDVNLNGEVRKLIRVRMVKVRLHK